MLNRLLVGGSALVLLAVLVPSASPAHAQESPLADHADRQIAFSRLIDGYWQICVCDAAGQESVQVTHGKADKRAPVWIASGAQLVYLTTDGVAMLLDLKSGLATRVLGPMQPLVDLDLARDGRVLCTRLTAGRTNWQGAYGLQTWLCSDLQGTEVRRLTKPLSTDQQACWIPGGADNELGIVNHYNQTAQRFELVRLGLTDDRGQEVLAYSEHAFDNPSVSPDGRFVAYSSTLKGNPDIWAYDFETGQHDRITRHGASDRNPVFSPDSKRVLFESTRGGIQGLWVVDLHQGLPVPFLEGNGPVRDPDWVEGVAFERTGFDPGKDLLVQKFPQQGVISVSLKAGHQKAEALAIWDSRGTLVHRLGRLEPGQQVLWGQTNLDGLGCDPGVYFVSGQETVGRALSLAAEDKVDVANLVVDTAAGTVKFDVPRTAWVKVQVGQKRAALFDVPLAWSVLDAGTHTLTLHGMRPAPLGSYLTDPRLVVRVRAYALPPNCLTIGKELGNTGLQGVPADLFAGRALPAVLGGDPSIAIRMGETSDSRNGEVPVVTGQDTVIRIDVPDGQDLSKLLAGRFELVLYLDGQFLMEDEDCSFPISIPLALDGVPDGRHCLLVNILGKQGMTGVAYQPFDMESGR